MIPDWVPLVKIANLVPEVTSWNITVGLWCIVLDFISRMLANRLMIDWFWLVIDWLWLVVDWFWLVVDWFWFPIDRFCRVMDWLWSVVHWLWFAIHWCWLTITGSMVMSISVVVSMIKFNLVVWSHIRILTLIEDFTSVDRCGFSIASIEAIVISSKIEFF